MRPCDAESMLETHKWRFSHGSKLLLDGCRRTLELRDRLVELEKRHRDLLFCKYHKDLPSYWIDRAYPDELAAWVKERERLDDPVEREKIIAEWEDWKMRSPITQTPQKRKWRTSQGNCESRNVFFGVSAIPARSSDSPGVRSPLGMSPASVNARKKR